MDHEHVERLRELLRQWQFANADAIVFLAGDLDHRVSMVVRLFTEGRAPRIVLTSSADDPVYGSLPASKLRTLLLEKGIPSSAIVWEETAPHTRAEAESTLRVANEFGWKKLILVTTEYHQYRAFLTWQKTIEDLGWDGSISVVPVEEHPHFRHESRDEAILREIERIHVYSERGHVLSLEEGVKRGEMFLNKNIHSSLS